MVMLAHFIEKMIKSWQRWTSAPFPTAKLSLYSEEKYQKYMQSSL